MTFFINVYFSITELNISLECSLVLSLLWGQCLHVFCNRVLTKFILFLWLLIMCILLYLGVTIVFCKFNFTLEEVVKTDSITLSKEK